MNTIPENAYQELLEKTVTDLLQEKLELLLRAEMKNYLEVEQPYKRNSRNGHYKRSLHTRYGMIRELKVPRDRKGTFQTQLFEPYQRREGWLEEAVIHMYKGGMSTREVARFIESLYGASTPQQPSAILPRRSWRTLSSGSAARWRSATPCCTWTAFM